MVMFYDETLVIDNLALRLVEEGVTKYFVPDPKHYVTKEHVYMPTELPVFYNPLMELNRDLSVLALKTYLENFGSIQVYVEALAGTGIRGFRIQNEVSREILTIQNDISPLAYKLMEFNKKYWRIKDDKMMIFNEDANYLLYLLRKKNRIVPDAIEIDPYGTPAPFLASTFNCIKGHNGLILITATDTAPLTGKYPNAALRKYGTLLKKTPFSKELAVRALVYAIGREATIFSKRIIPLLAIFTHHFIKIIALVRMGKKESDKFWKDVGWLQLHGDFEYRLIKLSNLKEDLNQDEKGVNNLIGPLWVGLLFNREFLYALKDSLKKTKINPKNAEFIKNMVEWETVIPEQLFYLDLHKLASKFKTNPPPVDYVITMLNIRGYPATRTHFNPWSIRTNAPLEVIIQVLKRYKEGIQS